MRTVRRLSPLLALGVVYVVMFVVLAGASPLVRLLVPAGLGLLAAIGVGVLLVPTTAQIRDAEYASDAKDRAAACRALLRQIAQEAGTLHSPSMRQLVRQTQQVVPDLLDRVAATSPTSLYSSASQLEGHLQSLLGVVRTYVDVEAKPTYYTRPEKMLQQGEEATRRFVDFAIDSIRLVNQGDIAEYRANLETVAPPTMPTLTTGGDQ